MDPAARRQVLERRLHNLLTNVNEGLGGAPTTAPTTAPVPVAVSPPRAHSTVEAVDMLTQRRKALQARLNEIRAQVDQASPRKSNSDSPDKFIFARDDETTSMLPTPREEVAAVPAVAMKHMQNAQPPGQQPPNGAGTAPVVIVKPMAGTGACSGKKKHALIGLLIAVLVLLAGGLVALIVALIAGSDSEASATQELVAADVPLWTGLRSTATFDMDTVPTGPSLRPYSCNPYG